MLTMRVFDYAAYILLSFTENTYPSIRDCLHACVRRGLHVLLGNASPQPLAADNKMSASLARFGSKRANEKASAITSSLLRGVGRRALFALLFLAGPWIVLSDAEFAILMLIACSATLWQPLDRTHCWQICQAFQLHLIGLSRMARCSPRGARQTSPPRF